MLTADHVESLLRVHRIKTAKRMFLELYLNSSEPILSYIAGDEGLTECVECSNMPQPPTVLSVQEAQEALDATNADIKMVELWLTMLNPEERFIIETHTIGGLDWARTIIEHEMKWGKEQGRSDRTLKRIQAKAINKLCETTNSWLHR